MMKILVLMMLVLNPTEAGSDTCNQRGILTPVNRYLTTKAGKITVTVDIQNFLSYIDKVVQKAPDFVKKAQAHTGLETLKELDPTGLIEFTSKYSLIKTYGPLNDTAKICLAKKGVLANLDDPEIQEALILYLIRNDIAEAPIDLHVKGSTLVSANGRFIVNLPEGYRPKDADPKVGDYYIITKEKQVKPQTMDNSGSTNATIFCLIKRNPFEGHFPSGKGIAPKWVNTIAKFSEKLGILSKIFKGILSFVEELKSFTSARTEVVKAFAPMSLIELANFLTTHSRANGFERFGEDDMYKVGRLLTYVQNLIYSGRKVLTKPKRMFSGMLDPILGLDALFGTNHSVVSAEDLKIKQKSIINENTVIEGELVYHDLKDRTETEVFEVRPYPRQMYSPKEGYIIRKGSSVVFKEQYEPPGICTEQEMGKVCHSIKDQSFTEQESSCARYLMSLEDTNTCKTRYYDHPLVVKSDCFENETILSSFYENYELKSVCNNKEVGLIKLRPGLSGIDTECKIKYGTNTLVPQEKEEARDGFMVKLIREYESLNFLEPWSYLIITIGIVTVILLLTCNLMLILKVCCPQCLNSFLHCAWCRSDCCNKRSSPSAPPSDLESPHYSLRSGSLGMAPGADWPAPIYGEREKERIGSIYGEERGGRKSGMSERPPTKLLYPTGPYPGSLGRNPYPQ